MELVTQTEFYLKQQEKLPKKGKHIVGNFSENSIVVYQAFNTHIANNAVKHQKFGGNHYNFNRMTWIKPGFMWMMYRAGWAQKENQEHILAIELSMKGFVEILKNAVYSSFQPDIYASKDDWQHMLKKHKVRLQWDPDHNPNGNKLERKAIQLGLKDEFLQQFNNEWVVSVSDITDFVKKQHKLALNSIEKLEVPIENVLFLEDEQLVSRIGISGYN